MHQDKKKVFWWIESSFFLLIITHIYITLSVSQSLNTIQILITEIFIYTLISLISYYMYDDKVIFSDPKIPIDHPRYDLTEDEKTKFYNQVFLNFGLLKLSIVIFLFCILLIELARLPETLIYLLIIILFFFLGMIIINLTRSVLSAKGFKNIPTMDILKKYTIYYNPNDKRSIVDKPFGIGTTINLASKQGKLIFGIILGIPLFIISLLIIVLSLAGKI